MNSYRTNKIGMNDKMFCTKDSDIIDLTSECNEEVEVEYVTTKFSLLFPELKNVKCDGNSLNALVSHSLVNYSDIMNSSLLKVHQKLDESKLIRSLQVDQAQNLNSLVVSEFKYFKDFPERELMLDNKESEESDIIVIKLSDEELKDMNKILDKVSERSNDYNSVQDSNSELENSFENFKEFKVLLKSVCDKENHNSQNLPQIKRKCNQNFSRWAKNKDKEVFNFLHKLLYKLSITMEEFFDFDPSTMFNEASLKIRRRLQREVITKLCKETNCNKEPYFLLKRILKKYACQKFTDSEINSLRRIINSLKPGSVVNIHKILYHFPGKTPRTMKSVIRDIMSHTLIEK